jgi:hypothetical protein
MQSTMHVYEVRPRNDRRGFDLMSDVLPFGRLWYEDARGGLISCDQNQHDRTVPQAAMR